MFTFIFKKEKEKCIIKIIYFNNIKLTLINIYISAIFVSIWIKIYSKYSKYVYFYKKESNITWISEELSIINHHIFLWNFWRIPIKQSGLFKNKNHKQKS